MLLLSILLCMAVRTYSADVSTEYGLVRGHPVYLNMTTDGSRTTILSFLGVPFARPPIGDLRFEPPHKLDKWDGVYDAKHLGAACQQNPVGVLWLTHPLWPKYSEDCLNLNIYTPEDLSKGPYPVMFWVYGGAFVSGANIQYPGYFLAAKDVIVVTVNYRVGVFGFMNTEDGLIKGNMGLYDQLMGLQFVKDNIANFGGDPNKITVFGQSAGGASTGLLQISPKSKGLFQQAIQESGTEQNFWSLNYPAQNPEKYVYQVAKNANCTTDNIPDMVACLRSISSQDLRDADHIQCTPGYFCQGFAPVVDGPGGFIPYDPLQMRNELKNDSVPLMSGICKDDGSLYTLFLVPEAGNGLSRAEFIQYYNERLLSIWSAQLTPQQQADTNASMIFYYSPYPYLEDKDANVHAMNQMITDAAFGVSWDRNGKINSAYKDTYLYVQAFRSLNASSAIPDWMGVPHMGELPYVWCYACLEYNPEVRMDSKIFYDVIGWTPEDVTYADYVITLWTNFAKYGNPTPKPIKSPFNDTLLRWDKFSIDDSLKVFYLDGEVSEKQVYRQQDYYYYIDMLSYIIDRPITSYENKAKKYLPKQYGSRVFKEGMEEYVLKSLKNIQFDSKIYN